MIELKIEHDYLVCDVDEWIADRTDGVCEEAQEALDAANENTREDSRDVEAWLDGIGATGLYGDGPARAVLTYNEDNFLSRDLLIILAHTEEWGDLLLTDYADAYGGSGRWVAWNFTGDDDADAYGYGSGYASCDCQGSKWHDGGCDAEWILESGGCYLWNNGGRGGMYDDGRVRFSDLQINRDGWGDFPTIMCPRCRYGTLTFWTS